MENIEKYRNFKQVINTFYNDELEKNENNFEKIKLEYNNVKIVPKFFYDKIYNRISIEFKLGKETFYKIKNLTEFYDRISNNEIYKYGSKLEFLHNENNFEKDSLEILQFILKYSEIIKYVNDTGNSNYRYYGKRLSESNIVLNEKRIDEIFEILKGKKIEIEKDGKCKDIVLIPNEPNIEIYLDKINDSEFKITHN